LICFYRNLKGRLKRSSDDLFIASLFAHEAFHQTTLRFYADYGVLAAQTNKEQRLQLQRVVKYGKSQNITVKITEIE